GRADASGPAARASLLGYAPRRPACLADSRGTSEGRAGRPIGWSGLLVSALLLPCLSAAATRRQAKAIETYQSALRIRAAPEAQALTPQLTLAWLSLRPLPSRSYRPSPKSPKASRAGAA